MISMTDILKHLQGLTPDGVQSAIGDATGRDLPVVVLSGSGEHREPDSATGGGHDSEFSGRVWHTAIAHNTEIAMQLSSDLTRAFTPHHRPARYRIGDWAVVLIHRNTSQPEIDRSLTQTDTGTHPAYVWATFDVHAQRPPRAEVPPSTD